MKVEMMVDWAEAAAPRTQNHQTTAEPAYPPRSRADRRLWYIAVGREIEAGMRSGRFTAYADIARQCRVSRARIAQVLNTFA